MFPANRTSIDDGFMAIFPYFSSQPPNFWRWSNLPRVFFRQGTGSAWNPGVDVFDFWIPQISPDLKYPLCVNILLHVDMIQIMCNYEKLCIAAFFPEFDLGISFHIANCGFMTTIPTTEFISKWSQQFQRSCKSKHRVCHEIWINMKYINPSDSKTWLQSLIWIDLGVS